MKRITLFIFIFLSINQLFSQALYNRIWGSTGNIPTRIKVAEPKYSTNELYINYIDSGQILILNKNNHSTKSFYTFPVPYVLIEQMKFDNNNNLIVHGRTHNQNLGTPGVYSPTPVPNNSSTSGYSFSFVAKISPEGSLIWLTYIHDIPLYTASLTIDSNNNIYALNSRAKTDVLSPSYFQNTGDHTATQQYQDVITKISPTGKHLWSTFYFNDKSEISSIVAGNDGLYVYGSYYGLDATNNYFTTKNSYQEYPTALGLSNDACTVFLTKFGFDGKRSWGTFFGDNITRIPSNFSSFPKALVVIGNDPYFITNNKSLPNQVNNISTSNAYLTTPPHISENITLTKFLGNGSRDWTTYLYSGQTLQKSGTNDLLVTSEIESTYSNISKLTTLNGYQPVYGGDLDLYISIFSNDGKSLKYGSFYGYEGRENGVVYPTKDGHFINGFSNKNLNLYSNFSTTGQTLFGISGNYYGYYTAYMNINSLNTNNFENNLQIKIYPNPTIDIINIQSKESLPINTSLTIYDMSGKRVLNQSVTNSNLNQINVSNLNSGAYILQIDNQNFNQSFKFIKK